MNARSSCRSSVAVALLFVGLGVVCPRAGWAGVVRYTTTTQNGAETALTSVTVEHGSIERIYKPEKLIAGQIVHFRSFGGVNVACGSDDAQMTAAARCGLLDGRLTCGVPNPGATAAPPSGSPILDGPDATPGLALRFAEPVVNRPGPDVVVFELQKRAGGDPFFIAPLEFQPGLHGLAVTEYDLAADHSNALPVAPVTLSSFTAAPQGLKQFAAGSLRRHSVAERGFVAAATSVDLDLLGYSEGQEVPGLFLQSTSGGPAFDPVAVLGLPAPTPDNLLAKEPEPAPFVPEQGGLLKAALDGPLAGCEEIVFAQRVSGRDHWYGNFGHYCETDSHYSDAALIKTDTMRYAFGEGGRLCRFNLRTGKLQVLVDDPAGGVRDPNVHYDGRKILFSYRRGGTETYHLYKINVDGTGLRQLTDGPDNDIEPIYTPDDRIVFCSSRCHRFVPCWRTQVATLYCCDADGRNVRMLSNNAEQENTPWMLPDGRILYMRWEYVDRNQLLYHHLWTINPDGTGVMVYFGNQHAGLVMLDAKPIPGTKKVVACFSPGHGRTEHMGPITVVDPRRGPDEMGMTRAISPRAFRDPYPLSEEMFLVADEQGIHLLDREGETQVVYRPPQAGARWACHEPRPLRPRKRERVIPSQVEPESRTGRLVLSDVYEGRNMEGVRSGEIKKLLVLEQLPKPANFSGGPEPLTIGGTFTLERVLGTVPVEPDGSAYMELPALRSLFFVALDQNELAVKRMQSFVTVQPGETTSCVGCHEQRTRAPHSRPEASLMATRRGPSRIERLQGVPDVLDFPRDVQPILDRHCAACHNADRRDGGVDLSGDRTPIYTASYWTMFAGELVADGRNKFGNRPPRTVGSSASRLMQLVDGSHYEATLSPREQAIVRLWIESGATYAGTYGALGSGMYTVELPEATLRRRCAECHTATKPTYRNPKKGAFYFQFGKREPPQPILTDINDIILIRHLAYFQLGESPLYQSFCNLDRPEKSLFLRAPLAAEAGGLQLCGRPVFQDTSDADYRQILAAIRDASQRLARGKRFDMQGFRPNRFYIREMQNFGVLPHDLPENAAVDTYATDQAYWRSVCPTAASREDY